MREIEHSKTPLEGAVKRYLFNIYYLQIYLLIILMCLGYALAYFLFAKRRGFGGDFYAVMYESTWWDGKGIYYGPIFVFEKWLVNAMPSVATIEFFAFSCLVFIACSLIILIKSLRLTKKLVIYSIIIWTFNPFFYYSFSVVANPEFLELLFLVIVFWGLLNKRYILAWLVLSCAVFVKLTPIIFAPVLLLFYFSWIGLITAVVTAIFILLIVSIGQNQNLLSSIYQLLPQHLVEPQPTSEQFLGLSSSLSRLFGLQQGADFIVVTNIALMTIFVCYLLALSISIRINRSSLDHRIKTAYIFSIFMCLLPIFHLEHVHRHTFVFLAPIFIIFRFILSQDICSVRARKFTILWNLSFIIHACLPIYVLDFYNFDKFQGIPFGVDIINSLLMVTEPAWINIILFVLLFYYGRKLVQDSHKHNQLIVKKI